MGKVLMERVFQVRVEVEGLSVQGGPTRFYNGNIIIIYAI